MIFKKVHPLNIDLFKPLSANLGPGHMYPDIFENGDFFLRFPKAKKINASTRGIFESFLPVHTKLLKRWKYDSMPY